MDQAKEISNRSPVKACSEINREIRSKFIQSGRSFTAKSATAADTLSVADATLSTNITRALASQNSLYSILSQLYNLPEVGVCVDFWRANIGTAKFMISPNPAAKAKGQAFADALSEYLNSTPMIDYMTFLAMFNDSSKDYVLTGNELYAVDGKFVDVGKYRFPRMIVPVKYADGGLSGEQLDNGVYEYTLDIGGKTLGPDKIVYCKRAATVYDEAGIPVIYRALRPIQKQLAENELDRSISKMGIMSSFVIIKYGDKDNARTDDELQELYDEISANIDAGIGFGVAPPDIAVESLFKGTSAGNFNRDKIYEMYIDSVNYAFGGVLSSIAPQSNTGSSSDRPLIILKNLLDGERETRRRHVVEKIVAICADMNSVPAPSVAFSKMSLTIQTESDIELKEFDRGIISLETYLEDKFGGEVSRLRREHDEFSDVIVPHDTPYTQSAGSNDPAPPKPAGGK